MKQYWRVKMGRHSMPEPVYVSAETKDRVRLVGREYDVLKMGGTSTSQYFERWNEARQYIIERAGGRVRKLTEELREALELQDQAVKMPTKEE